ncbi:hypothetical protein [Deinococcus ruber]|uniref:Uncharacterized protein n=1 Tax=Deinococcus ruber TaxID=1848197 RepID=A0A918F6B8_9DEIO|nr:hypothetical protein [Deinococcus ruber]GGR05427.1 hypothetical protein GCM10008957_17960 [Deinococcus ruber]
MIRLDKGLIPSIIVNPDDAVIAGFLDVPARRCVIALATACVYEKTILNGVRIEVSAWSDLSIAVYHEGNSVHLNALHHEPSDICEFEQGEKEISLAGFLREAQGWYRLVFRDPNISVEYLSEEKCIPQTLP